MNYVRLLIIVFFALIPEIICAQEAFLPENILNSPNRNSIILLSISGKKANGEKVRENGTAFFVSPAGFAITVAHVFYKNGKIDIDSERIEPDPEDPTSFVAGRLGSSGRSPVVFDLVSIDRSLDVAVVNLRDPPEPVSYLKVCTNIPDTSTRLYAFGFIAGQALNSLSGFRTGNLTNGRYPVDIPINPGVSGGPIIAPSGAVFAVALGGVREPQYQGYNFVSPFQFLQTALQTAGTSEDCRRSNSGPITVPTDVKRRPNVIVGQRTVLWNGFTKYSISSFSFNNKQIVPWGDMTADFGAAHAPTVPANGPISLFFPYNAPPYQDARNAQAGIIEAPIQNLQDTDDCPRVGTYAYHWFNPTIRKVYCARARDGKGYAKLWFVDIRPDSIFFDWIYQEEVH